MTAEQLIKKFNIEFGNLDKWPKTYIVNDNTYANCCQYVFNYLVSHDHVIAFQGDTNDIPVTIGLNNGLMFKNVELLLKKDS